MTQQSTEIVAYADYLALSQQLQSVTADMCKYRAERDTWKAKAGEQYAQLAASRTECERLRNERTECEQLRDEALEEIRELVMIFALVGNDSQRSLSQSIIGIFQRIALTTKEPS